MMSRGPATTLGIIYSIFLGLMVVAFFAVGTLTFYPYWDPYREDFRALERAESEIRSGRPFSELTQEDRMLLEEISQERSELFEASDEARRRWGRNSSILLVTLATLSMATSLFRPGSWSVLSNGMLLGGVFTMLYGIGWIAISDSSISRFVVITIALLITLALGFIRFARRRSGVHPSVSIPADPEGLGDIERRLGELERRMRIAARALGEEQGPSSDS